MSRLDEALKRAGVGDTAESTQPASIQALDVFAPESPRPADRPRPADAAPDRMSAPAAVRAERHVAPVADARERAVVHRGDKLVGGDEIGALAVEQYRRVAAVLHHAQRERGIKTLMVGSAVAGEGKTLTAANLALTLSESYRRRVLLIDADLRRPLLHQVLGVDNTAGLSGILHGRGDVSRLSIPITPLLQLLPGGRPDPDPMSGLTSERMAALVRDAAQRVDWVMLDTPPLALVPDANVLSRVVDAAVLVIGASRTPLPVIQRAVDAIGRPRILGVVLNGVDERSLAAEYGSGRYYRYGYAQAQDGAEL